MPSKPDSKPSKPAATRPAARTVPTFDPGPSARLADQALRDTGVTAVVIGRVAVWAWVTSPSEQAYTKDLDFAVARADVPKLRAWATKNGLAVAALPIGGINASDEAAGLSVDFIDRSSGDWGDLSGLFAAAIAAAQSGARANVGGRELLLVPPSHLVAMKLCSGRGKDDEDARRLLTHAAVDVAVVRTLLKAHGGPAAQGRFEELLQTMGHSKAKKRYKLS